MEMKISKLLAIFALAAVIFVSGCAQGGPAAGGTTGAAPKSAEEVSKVVTDVGKDVQGISDILSEVDKSLSGKAIGK